MNAVRSAIRASDVLEDGVNFEGSRVKKDSNEYEFVCTTEEDRTRVINTLTEKGLVCTSNDSGDTAQQITVRFMIYGFDSNYTPQKLKENLLKREKRPVINEATLDINPD